ncbi:Protein TRIGALACTOSYLDIACYLGLYCEROL 4 chloroplastic [Bienertia sinuspersici]
MNRLRWIMDGGGFWEVDLSTPITMDGVARPLPINGPLPLGLSRGTKLSRPKQIDFFQRFMAAPFVPSFSRDNGFSLQRALSIPSGNDWDIELLINEELLTFGWGKELTLVGALGDEQEVANYVLKLPCIQSHLAFIKNVKQWKSRDDHQWMRCSTITYPVVQAYGMERLGKDMD